MASEIDQAVELAAQLCMYFEGFRARPYLCPAGVPTIGYGSTHYPGGLPVTLSDPPVSRETARDMLLHDLRFSRLPAVTRLCRGLRSPEQRAAIIDFAYNLGNGALMASTLRRRINAGRFDDVPGELRKWVNAGGRRLPGLVRRRDAEVAMWCLG